MRRVLSAIAVAGAVIVCAPAGAGDLVVADAWFRALPAGLPAGGYFTLHNKGAKVVLTGAESPACGMLMLHRSAAADGVATMAMVASVDVPSNGSVTFGPGAYHLMCTGPTAAMKPGGSVEVTLDFADGRKLAAVFTVRNAAGK